jgi:putative ABC transport system permease protein
MLRNYLLIAIRTLWKNKTFSAINTLGLAIGISASLVIYLLVSYHFRFNRLGNDDDRVYRVVSNFNFSGEIYYNSGVPDPMAATVRKEATGMNAAIAFRNWNEEAKISIPVPGKTEPSVFKRQKRLVFADSNYFSMVPYRWLSGSAASALLNPYQLVLTESAAAQYFPGLTPAQVTGKELFINDSVRTTVTGIVQDLATHTDFTFRIFVAYSTLDKTSLKPDAWDNWDNTNGAQQFFVKLSAGTDTTQFTKQVNQLYKKYHVAAPGDNSTAWFTLQPLQDLHFNADFGSYDIPVASKPTLYGLLAVAAFLLLLGCINFINLTTAYSANRSKEIGIRKTMGSSKKQLIIQFLSETFLLTMMATILSVLLIPLLLKAFEGFVPEGLRIDLLSQPYMLVFITALIVVVTFLAGFYPALVLSAYKPVQVLKNQAFGNTGKTRTAFLRKSLSISQFVIAQVFIMATLLVGKQLHYWLNKDLGFKKEAILYVNINYRDTSLTRKHAFMDRLSTIPQISMISMATNPPSSGSTWSSQMKFNDGKKEIEVDVQQKYGDTNYIKLFGLKLLAGKNIEQTDTVTQVLINETYARILGFTQPQQALGRNIHWGNNLIPIIGVVADFNQRSLHEKVKPLVIGSRSPIERTINIALHPQNESGTNWKTAIGSIEKTWKAFFPEEDFEYRFFDESIAKYYTDEQNISRLLTWATALAIFISCLGLLGLVIYVTGQRTKEIGIRKVLGASLAQIVSLIAKDFLLLVLLAFVIALPIAWFGMNKWLENFAYRTTISWWIFLMSGCGMIIIALLTLGFQTIKAAMANPVKSLRTE